MDRGGGPQASIASSGPAPSSSGPPFSRNFSAIRPAFWRIACSIAERDARILLQEELGVLPALAETLTVIGEPGAGLLDDPGLDAEIDQLAGLGDALAVHDVELDLLERRARACS